MEWRLGVGALLSLRTQLCAESGVLLLQVDKDVSARGTVVRWDPAERVQEDESVEQDGLLDGGGGRLVRGVGGE